jgi:glyoxylase I family protein
MVEHQDKALRFYTEVLGFRKKNDIPVGEYRWITVVAAEGPNDLELALEPNANPAGKTFQGQCSARAFQSPHLRSPTSRESAHA